MLTEEDHFRGLPADLDRVAPAGLPRLRKDFLLDESMVIEGLLWGADAVLLLACVLEGPRLGELRAVARELGIAALVEVHDDEELERALLVEPDLVGVNARDLTTFTIDLATIERLIPEVPERFVRVAESGIATVSDQLPSVWTPRPRACHDGRAVVEPKPSATISSIGSATRKRESGLSTARPGS